MATIKDIAKAAGVSVTTVSNVIHGNAGRVSPATIERIKQIMKEMHYVPNMGARMLVRNRSKIIGVIIHGYQEAKDGTFHSPFTAEILGAIEREIRRNGYYMMLYASDSQEEIIDLVANWNVDGIITIGLGMDFCDPLKEKIRIPIVFTDCFFTEPGYVNVGTEDEEGGYLAAKYLLEHGHRRIGFVTESRIPDGEIERRADGLRLHGFRWACEENGISWEEEMLVIGEEFERSKELCDRLQTFTGVVVSSDYYALVLMDALRHRGVKIPEELSVVGFDDILMSHFSSPRLTTIHQGVPEKGILAVQQLLKLLRGEVIEKKDIRLPVRIIERESVREVLTEDRIRNYKKNSESSKVSY